MSNRLRRNRSHSFLSRIDDVFICRKKLEYAINMLQQNGVIDEIGFDYIYRVFSPGTKSKFFEKFNAEAEEMADVDGLKREIPGKFAEFAVNLAITNRGVNKFIAGLLKRQYSILMASKRVSVLEKRMDELKQVFSLDEFDMELLVAIYLAKEDSILVESFSFMDLRRDARKKLILVNHLTGLSAEQISHCLADTGKLRRYGVIYDELEITDHINSFLSGFGGTTIQSSFFTEFSGKAVPIDCHETVREHTEIIKNIIMGRKPGDGVNILIHGSPGTGKTEYARSLAIDLKMKTYEVLHMEDKPKTSTIYFRLASISACQNSVDTEKSIIIIDEADAILNGKSEGMFFLRELSNPNKGIVNNLIDCAKGVSIWITNSIDGIEESTRRRFDYAIEFKKLSLETKKHIWTSCAGKYGLDGSLKSEEIERLAGEYDISAGGIDITLKNMRRIVSRDASAGMNTVGTINSLLKSHIRIVSGDKAKSQDLPVDNYSIDGLNISGLSAEKTMQVLNRFCNTGNSVKNINLLLAGAPGTGKTEFVKYIAKELKKKLVVKRGSDILSMWVGGSEKAIRDAFAEAERDNAILFVDEADGLITERGNASRNWEVTQTNEFLCQMENFHGIMICATNFKKNMDTASMRRFHIKLEFDYLTDEGKRIFYSRFFGDGGGAEDNWQALQSIKCLTPGDFRNVRQRMMMLGDTADAGSIINALREEVSMKNEKDARKIGF